MPQMSPDESRWAGVSALLDELLELEPEARNRALERAARRDAEAAAQAGELLRAMEDPQGEFFDSPLAIGLPDLVSQAFEDALGDRSGKLLGNYRLISVLGRGGMGVVYMAERADREFEKKVAIKLLPSGLENPEAEQRFRRERQILARLEHPGIARLLDGGVTEEGYPYLVMELVDGSPIDRYCDRTGLDLRSKIRLFIDVCDAVQHAHQNLVIHRDLKPGNIYVDADGNVKLLDFGVAKLLEEGDRPLATRSLPHTPGYAAPEQLANQSVSTSSDTYSLGVVLERLLLANSAESGTRPARGGTGPTPSKDLDRILDKAKETEPDRRYPTAATLADDLRCFLAGEPVSARESTRGYRLRRFVGRHRVGVALSVIIVSILSSMFVLTLVQESRVRAEAARSQKIAGLLSGLFADANPWAPSSGKATLPELLDRSVSRVRDELGDDRETRAHLLALLGRAYNSQAQPERGIPLLEEVLDERLRLFGEEDSLTTESMSQLGYALLEVGRANEAARLIESSVEITERFPERAPRELAERLFVLGRLRHAQGDPESHEKVFGRVVDLLQRDGQEPSSTLALALGELSVALDTTGRNAESLALQREAVATAEETLGPDHPYTATLRNNLGVRLIEAGDHEAAAVHYRRALALLDERPDISSAELIITLSNLGRTQLEQGEFVAARPYLERAIQIARAEMPRDDSRRIGVEINRATLFTELGYLEEAEKEYRFALQSFQVRFGPDHQNTARVRSLLGANLQITGRLEEADEELSRALAAQRDPNTDPRSVDETLVALGRLRFNQANFTEARALLEEAMQVRARRLPIGHWRIAEVEVELAALDRLSGGLEIESANASLRLLESTLPAANYRLQRASRLLFPGQ
jgi:serine/threonine protein kinase/Tfp pilus assembly protein PilF